MTFGGLLLMLPIVALGDVFKYTNTPLNTGAYLVRRVEMFNSNDAPSSGSPGNGRSYIQLELMFTRTPKDTGSLETPAHISFATVAAEKLNIGLSEETNGEKKEYFCCTESIAAAGMNEACTKEKVNTLIIRNDPHTVQYSSVEFPAGSHVATSHSVNAKFPITRSGPHILVVSNCDPVLMDFNVEMNGTTVWMNPYGYLPATSYYFMPFYGTMALLYLALAVIWMILNALYWKDIVMLQNYITCVLGVCLIENMVLYFDYNSFNSTGHRNEVTLFLGAILTISRRTIARMLIMAVSIGFALVRPDLGKNKKHIINFGLLYFCVGLIQQILIDLGKVHTGIGDHWRTLLAIPVAAADSGCYWFVFISLYHLITMLRVRQQIVKLALYKSFTKVLVVSVVLATIFSIYHMIITARHQVLKHWRIWWFLDEGVWNIIFSVIFLAVCFLFRPSQAAKRYAYSQLATDMADDEYGLGELEDEEAAPLAGEELFSLGDDDLEPVVDKKTAKVD
mmetsp:Transcript_19513/g.29118  ORF Transcript_19513/g.29118 Transcript_19513/m.29118 type:complete len:508 (+) Transcript_19513:62-1585(+)